ncbi:MAG: DUF1311 domain-containing protein [Alysiella sp.]|uniref:lysozyme inhibitor LprI family protein n=1 Tax=Alysiella sp. TaxID=1872483 RepID=UPI0026DB68D4|nr:lysozyme inhibitor LprI family protein [Alysiella sp.]MDO4433300.1 DUF1311 domain-containing protein [Alysiella sp.]
MNKTLTALAAFSLLLSACSDNQKKQADVAAASATAMALCQHSTLPDQVRAAVHKGIREAGHQAAMQDNNQWLDGNQSAEMAMQIDVHTLNQQTAGQACQAKVSIVLPAAVLEKAAVNAPLFQAALPLEHLAQRTQNGNIQFANNTLTFPLNYIAQEQNGQFSFTPNDANLNTSIKILSEALLPYAVKDTIIFNGRKMSRQAALKELSNPKLIETASEPESQIAEVPTVHDTSQATPTPTASAPMPEMLTPEIPKVRISRNELEEARNANHEAGQSIRSAWRKIPVEIQESLVQEQRNWESKKQQNCRNAGAKGSDATERQYLQIQCDTRMTRERMQYLNGFSIE